jgi:hypothetical protein
LGYFPFMKIFTRFLCFAALLTLCTEDGFCQEYQLSIDMRIPFKRFTVLGTYIDFEKFGKEPWTPVNAAQSSSVTAERPAPKSVIRF